LFVVLPKTNQLLPKCVLPRNMSGTWFTQGQQFKSDVFINETHISFKTKINQFELLETYYTCQQTQGTRYMMTKVTTNGGCCGRNRMQLPMQPVSITTNVVSFNPVYLIQHYVIKFVSDLQQVNGFLRVLLFPASIKCSCIRLRPQQPPLVWVVKTNCASLYELCNKQKTSEIEVFWME
jgi:hypothetical protein